MTRDEQVSEATANIKEAFRRFTEARRHLTIWEFQDFIAKHLNDLGSQGFVASIGEAIVAAAADQQSVKTNGE